MTKTMMTTQLVKLESIQDNIPIISDEVAKALKFIILKRNIKNVLEIGTAYSYSAHVMADALAKVYTVERDLKKIDKIEEILKTSMHKENIQLIKMDAKYLIFDNLTFDLIFIDGAKSQYQHMFSHLSKYLSTNGLIVCDNMFFHHLKVTEVKRQTRQLLKKLETFKIFLSAHSDFESKIFSIGDGLSISFKKDKVYDKDNHHFLSNFHDDFNFHHS